MSATATNMECTHCGLPVPRALRVDGAAEQFCCAGCRAVFECVRQSGLDQDYAQARRVSAADPLPLAGMTARVTGRRFEHLDREDFLSRAASSEAPGTLTAHLRVDGIRCGACIWLIEALPRIIEGLVESRMDAGRMRVSIRWDPQATALSSIAQRLDSMGYQLLAIGDASSEAREREIDRAWLARVGIAAAISMNAMGVAFALYGGLGTSMAEGYRALFQWTNVGLAVLAIAWPGRVFFSSAWAAIRARTPHMDIPVAVGLGAAVSAGAIATHLGNGSVYCEGAAMLVFLLLLGRWVQHIQQRRARMRVEWLFEIVPSIAIRVVDDGLEEVPVEALLPGDIVEVAANDAAPADGFLLTSTCHLNMAHLTGESTPAALEAGAMVYAGAQPIGAPIRLQVIATGTETRAARLLALVEEAAGRRAPVCELANRIAGWFLLTVLTLAAFTTCWWWTALGATEALERTVALLVVTCPCALGLATPLAIQVGIGRSARRGVLVKGGDVLQTLSHKGTVILDKTGTITEGRMGVVHHVGSKEALALAARIEEHSSHPIAKAICAAFGSAEMSLPDEFATEDVVVGMKETAGLGVSGWIKRRRIIVGSRSHLEHEGVNVSAEYRSQCDQWAAAGKTPVLVALDGRTAAACALGDPVRADSAETVRQLKAMGWHVVMASGDHPAVARSVGRAVGLEARDIHAALSPEDKARMVREGNHAHPIVFVGDGVNDLAALATADCGVAVRGGAQAAFGVADVCLVASGVSGLLRLLSGARTTMRTIHLNLAVSLAYNFAGGAAAFFGLVNPLIAAILMPLSALTVLALSSAVPGLERARISRRAIGPTNSDRRQ